MTKDISRRGAHLEVLRERLENLPQDKTLVDNDSVRLKQSVSLLAGFVRS
jgi:hypothetical protein